MKREGPLRLAVLASGNGSNFEAICRAIDRGQVPAQVAVVVSDREGAFVLERARRRGIPAVQCLPRGFPSKDAFFREIDRTVREAGAGLVALAGFMRLLPPWFVRAWAGKVMNVHPSLLPAFPGLDAPRQALEYGVKVAGCTVHFVDEGMDTGPIILQAAVPVYPDDDVARLTARIQRREHRLYPRAIAHFARGELRVRGRRVEILCQGGAGGGRRDGSGHA